MKLAAWMICGWIAGNADGAEWTNANITIRSGSEQFIVRGVPPPRATRPDLAEIRTPTKTLRLEPSTLAVACERIKTAFLKEIAAPDQWRGRIFVNIQFTVFTNTPVTIQPFNATAWQYRVTLPDEIETNKLVRAIVNVLLLEQANRQTGPGLAEVPLWLVEGMTRHLLATSSRDLIVQPLTRLTRMDIRADALVEIRNRLRLGPSLTFEQLGQPSPDRLQGPAWELFQASAHLFVSELLKLPDGPQCMQEFLRLLPAALNWQIPFLKAFQAYFDRPLAVEKWWALHLVNVGGMDQWHGWSPAQSGQKLDEILRLPVYIHSFSNSPPQYSQVSVQQFMARWDLGLQRQVFASKISQLQGLRVNAWPSLIPLINEYLRVLDTYLKKAPKTTPAAAAKLRLPPPGLLRDATFLLEQLDARRNDLRQRWSQPAAAPGPGSETAGG